MRLEYVEPSLRGAVARVAVDKDFLGLERHSEVLDASTYVNQPKQHNIFMDNTYQSDIETTATVVREHTVAFRFVKYLRHRA